MSSTICIAISIIDFGTIWWLSFAALFVLAHNFWLIAKKQASRVRIEANTGHDFPNGESAVKPERVREFKIVAANGSFAVTKFLVENESLVGEAKAFDDQSFYAAIELHPQPISLQHEKFAGYIADEDAAKFVAPDFIGGETIAAQRESYAKFAKVFVAAEDQTDDRNFAAAIGHRFEIVPQTAFSELRSGNLTVRVLFENKPIANLRVSSGCENRDGAQYFAHARTDENGAANFEIERAGQWFVRTHFIRTHEDRENYEWESFWASLTFTK